MDNIYGVIIIILLIIVYINYNKAGFNMTNDRVYITSTIIENIDEFKHNNYSNVKKKIPWIDAGIYADVRKLLSNNKPINNNTLSVIFR